EQLDFLKNYLVYYEENILPFRTYKNQPITKRTADKQKTVIQKLQGFLSTLNVNVRVSEYGVIMGNQFVTYMKENVTSNDNTVGKYLKYTKTIVQEAKTLGIETHPTLDSIKGFTTETPTVIFTDDEL